MTIIACSRGPFNSARQAAEGVRAGVKPVRGGPTGDLLCRAIVETRVEEATCRGQVDLVIAFQSRVWWLEFKVADLGDGQGALDQIRARGDHHRYAGQPVTLIGMDFSREQRDLAGFAWERG